MRHNTMKYNNTKIVFCNKRPTLAFKPTVDTINLKEKDLYISVAQIDRHISVTGFF